MPFFFLLSGYVFRSGMPLQALTCKRFRTLLVPYAGYALLGFLVTLLIPQWRAGLSVSAVLKDIWMANPEAVHNSSIWFLECLFLVQLLFWFIHRHSVKLQAVICVFLYALGIAYSRHPIPFLGFNRLPLNLDVVPVATFFFAMGCLLNRTAFVEKHLISPAVSALLSVIGGAGVLVCYQLNGYVNLHGLSFGNPAVYIAGGLAGTAMVIGFSKWLCDAPTVLRPMKRVLLYYGKNSLTVLGVQSLAIRLIILCLNAFGHHFTLYHLPRKHALLTAVIVGFLICPAACCVVSGMKAFFLTQKVKSEALL